MLAEDKRNGAPKPARNLEQEVFKFISQDVRSVLKRLGPEKTAALEEIRLRANKPLVVQNYSGDYFLSTDGRLTDQYGSGLYAVPQEEIFKTLELMSENSIYAYQDEIKSGFLTLKGGHRVGIAGKIVIEGGQVKNIKDISSLNIRISREVPGCSAGVIKYLIKNSREVFNTLVVSPPQCGKTTMLRDMTRLLSDGIPEMNFKGVKIGVVDERSEIAACYKGIPQNNVGVRTDVLDACPKSLGMAMLLRSMSPQVIVTDEIGGRGDKEAVMEVINAGVKLITTAHGYNISELKSRQEVLSLMEGRVFERYIVLSNRNGPGTVEEIIDGKDMSPLVKRKGDWHAV
ncbi:MAG: stage III sporulation protein AA [Clostridiales bacterium]|nr:stage III sporulation protein AA [Eubacteriales bacterium]MDH7565243.1 stage III sporulation protein AA [Clostridiales bacterium]